MDTVSNIIWLSAHASIGDDFYRALSIVSIDVLASWVI